MLTLFNDAEHTEMINNKTRTDDIVVSEFHLAQPEKTNTLAGRFINLNKI